MKTCSSLCALLSFLLKNWMILPPFDRTHRRLQFELHEPLYAHNLRHSVQRLGKRAQVVFLHFRINLARSRFKLSSSRLKASTARAIFSISSGGRVSFCGVLSAAAAARTQMPAEDASPNRQLQPIKQSCSTFLAVSPRWKSLPLSGRRRPASERRSGG